MKTKVIEIAKKVKSVDPKACGDLSERQVTKIIELAFAEVKSIVGSAEDKRTAIQKLGSFRSKQVELNKDGKKEVINRTVFKPAK